LNNEYHEIICYFCFICR